MADDLTLLEDGQYLDLTPIEEDSAEPAPLTYDENAPNLVPALKAHPDGVAFLKKLADQVVRDADEAYDGSEVYRAKIAENFRIYAGDIPDKDFPFEGCAKAHVPILLIGATRLGARLFSEIFSDDQFFGVNPTGPDDQETAQILTLHGKWQFANVITDWTRQQHRGVMWFFTAGDVVFHSYYDFDDRRNRHDVLTCDDFIAPFVHVSVAPDYSDVPYKIKILRLQKHQVERRQGEWDEVDAVLDRKPPSYDDDEPEAKLRNAIAQTQGIIAPDDSRNAPYKFYEYHGWAKLPGQPTHGTGEAIPPTPEVPHEGGDGAEIQGFDGVGESTTENDEDAVSRPICCTVDPRTKTVVQLYIREESDWRDVARQRRHEKELADWQQNMDQLHQMEQRAADMQAQGMPSPIQLPPPPPPPSWVTDPENPTVEPARKVPIEMFSHGVCIENPLGNLGLSFGTIWGEFNKAADTALSQFVDQATLSNAWSVIAPEGLEFDGEELVIAPGKINRVRGVSGPDIRNSIVELKPQPANDQLVRLVDMLKDWGEEAGSAPSVLSGQEGKSGETYRGIATRVEQALKQLSVAGLKYVDALTQVLRNNAKLNAMFLPDEEIVFVNDHIAQMGQQIRVTRQMYERDYSVTISSDMRFVSQAQRIQEADQLLALPKALPPPLVMQPGFTAFWWQATKKALVARGLHDMVQFLGPAPPMPATPFGLPPPPPPGMVPPGPPQPGAQPPHPPGPPGQRPAQPPGQQLPS